jgi:uncharacterized phage protein gp47/JayE
MNIKTARQLLGEMIAASRAYAQTLTDTTLRITDWSIGQPQFVLLHSVAIELSRIWLTIKRAYHSLFVALAIDDDLSLRALDYGTSRGSSVAASTTLRAYCGAGTYPITFAVGLRAESNIGMAFSVSTAVTVTSAPPSGYVDLAVLADTTGAAGNVRQNTITVKLGTWPTPCTRVTNPFAASGGADLESDDLLRARLARRWKLAAKGVSDCYLAWLQETYPEGSFDPGFDGRTVIRALSMPKTNLGETTTIVVQNSGDAYSGAELVAMEVTLNGVGALRLGSKVPLHETVDVVNLVFTTVDVEVEVQFIEGYTISDVKADIEQAIADYLDWVSWDWGGTAYLSAIESVVQSVPGVAALNVASLKLNTVGANVTVPYDSLPKCGHVTITGDKQKNW